MILTSKDGTAHIVLGPGAPDKRGALETKCHRRVLPWHKQPLSMCRQCYPQRRASSSSRPKDDAQPPA